MDKRLLCAVVAAFMTFSLFAGAAFAQGPAASDPSMIVREIVIQGNVEISSERIRERIRATVVGEPLDREKVQQDVQEIAGMGYFENVEAVPVAGSDGVRLTVIVEEFPVVGQLEIHIVGGVVAPERVAPYIDARAGEILNAINFGESMDHLPVRTGESLGYVLRPTNVEFRGAQFDTLYVELTPVRVGAILIEGNEKTRDEVIIRELPIKTGDILSMDQVRVGLMRLGQLGFFEPIIPEFLSTEDPLVVDILLPVVETQTGRAAFGGGYSSADGLVGYVEVADNNFLGRGSRANVRWEFGQRKNTYDLGFHEPYVMGRNISAGINLYNRMNLRDHFVSGTPYRYEEKRIGGDLTLGRPIGQFTRGFVTFKTENSSIDPRNPDGIPAAADNRTRSFIVSTRTDTTDHLYFPTLGFRYNVSVERAGPFFGGDTNFTKLQNSLSGFRKAGSNNQTWAFRVMTGHSVGELPTQDQYRVGGADTVRGYRQGEMRGDTMMTVQGEYRFPISETVHGVVFADAGNAWIGSGINLSELKAGYGLGIRFNTPLGVLRLDYGIGQQGGHTYFSIGPSF